MIKKTTLLAITIAIIFAFFVGYGIEVFHPSPDREDFCPNVFDLTDKESCVAAGGEWNTENVPKVEGRDGMCNQPKDCYRAFEEARAPHDRVVFIASLLIGLAAFVVGVMLRKDSVSTGLSGGAILLILYGTIRYWEHADNVLKFVLLGIALAILIWVGYTKLK